jgi:hypothetical protein
LILIKDGQKWRWPYEGMAWTPAELTASATSNKALIKT